MKGQIKSSFRDIIEEWDRYWRDSVEFYEFLDKYVEVSDDRRTYVIKRKRPGRELQ